MNEIALSNNLKQIELEIQWHKENAGRSVWEVGRRLNHVKENDLAHGEFIEWLDVVGIEYTSAKRMMKVAKELSNSATLHHLGETALYLIATLPEEERKKEHTLESGETKTVDEMTVRELQEVKKKNKKLEETVQQFEFQQDVLREENQRLKDRKPEVIEKTIEKIPEDYNRLRNDYQNKVDENYDLKKQIEQLAKVDSKVEHQQILKDNVLKFCTKVEKFITEVGGLAWLTDYFEELDSYERNSYLKALDLIEGWALTVKSNINKEEI